MKFLKTESCTLKWIQSTTKTEVGILVQLCEIFYEAAQKTLHKAALLKLKSFLTVASDERVLNIFNEHCKHLNLPFFIHTDLKVSLILACKNREEHLLKVLPSWINVPQIKQIVIVDYSSTKPLSKNRKIQKLIKGYSHQIQIITVRGEQYFNLGRAYNLAYDFTTEKKILKIDCDFLSLDSSWISEVLLNYKDEHFTFFLRGDRKFAKSTTGALFCNKRDFVYYKEDLTGWGFDDYDLSKRMLKNNPELKELIWYDINSHLKHIKHGDFFRVSNYDQKNLSISHFNNILISNQPSLPVVRNEYKVFHENKSIFVRFKTYPKLQNVWCINLKQHLRRWEHYKIYISQANRFDAINTINCNTQSELTISPCNLTYDLYFKEAKGAKGCFLSHYNIWKKIVSENMPYAIITEDDINPSDLKKFLNQSNEHEHLSLFEFVQIGQRFSYSENDQKMLFHGTEGYMLTLSGAKKLLKAVYQPALLEYVQHKDLATIKEAKKQLCLPPFQRRFLSNSIIAPVDKFISMCCDPDADESVRLAFYNYPVVKLHEELSKQSTIMTEEKKIWKMTAGQIKELLSFHYLND